MMPWRFPVQLSEYFLRRLRGGGEFTFYRAHAKEIEPPSVLLPAPDSTRPSTEILEKIDHECSLRSELNPDWAVRPLALSERGAPITLVLEDSGGETLDGCWKRWRSSSFLGSAVGFTTTLEALHERELIHKGVKPTNDLAHSLTDQAGLMDFGSPPAFCASTRPPNLQGSSPEQCLTWLLNELGERSLDRLAKRRVCPRRHTIRDAQRQPAVYSFRSG